MAEREVLRHAGEGGIGIPQQSGRLLRLQDLVVRGDELAVGLLAGSLRCLSRVTCGKYLSGTAAARREYACARTGERDCGRREDEGLFSQHASIVAPAAKRRVRGLPARASSAGSVHLRRAAALQRARVSNDDHPPAKLDETPALQVAQDAVRRGPRCSGQFGQLLLRERDLAAVELAELGDPAQDALVRRQVVRLRQLVGQPPYPLAEQSGKQAVDARMLAPEPLEVPDEDGAGLGRLERGNRRRPLSTFAGEQRELTECIARSAHAEECGRAEWRRDPDGEPAADDQMEAVGGIAAMEHDFAAVERPPAGNRQQPPHVLLRDPVE